ncbi:hypothetical protein [Candidatus Nitrosotenuis sp. DW1]|uniref:hypothetical protein n=1 Tax=Candidatus Nitrosotenuis sp. DW1 TaxID=2259672 RepID=UPI0015CCAD2D|nr:hypothetical protein [Candidatus Nitrosotenuis sp. DW1]QLH08584.1 hypothetical protein DSQ19_03010 [Candidatus Nitrosotenuis sp. DW1]
MEKEEFIESTKDKLSKIPYGEKDAVTSMLEVLPYLQGEDLRSMMEDINYMVEPEYVRQFLNCKNPLLPDISDDLSGRIKIGKIMVGDTPTGDCLIDLNDLIQTAIIAAPNKGKTRLIFNLIREILKLNDDANKTSIIFLDRKQDGRRAGKEFVVLSTENIFINLFDAPPGCDPRKWMSDVCQLLMSVWQYYQRSRNTLMKVVYNLYETKKKPPMLLEVYEAMKEEDASNRRMSSRKLEVNEVNEDRIENSILEFGTCFSRRRTFPLSEFLDKGVPLVIEADVSNDSFALLLGWLLLYIYRYRKSNNMRGNVSENGTILMCDEAYLLWQKAREFSESRRETGASFTDVSALYVRDFRMAIVAASQSVLSADYMASTNLKCVGYCADYQDAKYLANSLGDPELVSVITKLKVGQFIIKIGDKKPALLQTEDYPLQSVSDSDLKERMKPFVDYISEYCKEEEEEEPQEIRERVRLSRDAKKILFDVVNYPDSTISVRYGRLGLKGKKAQETVEEVVTSKYAETVEEAIEGSKSAKYLVLTQPAIEWLKTQNVDVSHIQHIGKTSPLHALYQNILQAYLKRLGWSVRHDFAVGDKFVDVYAEKDKRVAFEVAVSDAVNKDRVVSALDLVEEYIFLCRDLAVINSIRAQMSIQSEKVKYFVANQYLIRLKKDVLAYSNYKNENNQNTQNKQNSDPDNAEQEKNRRDPQD